ncbi:hypothetical protein [Arthrobacter sp. A5]|uniref:hypothetical protein n=1 Tax=Arthrobacter sp. A5 TaxID=576926 RepID=UPI003DA9BD9C
MVEDGGANFLFRLVVDAEVDPGTVAEDDDRGQTDERHDQQGASPDPNDVIATHILHTTAGITGYVAKAVEVIGPNVYVLVLTLLTIGAVSVIRDGKGIDWGIENQSEQEVP